MGRLAYLAQLALHRRRVVTRHQFALLVRQVTISLLQEARPVWRALQANIPLLLR